MYTGRLRNDNGREIAPVIRTNLQRRVRHARIHAYIRGPWTVAWQTARVYIIMYNWILQVVPYAYVRDGYNSVGRASACARVHEKRKKVVRGARACPIDGEKKNSYPTKMRVTKIIITDQKSEFKSRRFEQRYRVFLFSVFILCIIRSCVVHTASASFSSKTNAIRRIKKTILWNHTITIDCPDSLISF